MAGEENTLAPLLRALQHLTPKDSQELRTKFPEGQVEGGWKVPGDPPAKAAHPGTLGSCVGEDGSGEAAAAMGLLEEMSQRELAEKLLDEKVEEFKRRYREHVVWELLRNTGVNSSLGENPSISSSSPYTTLSISRKPGSDPSGAGGAPSTGHSSLGAATRMLFGARRAPRVVVLLGAAGMGKTTTVRRVMGEWVEGAHHTQFDYVFCLDCQDVALAEEASVLDLVSKCCPHGATPPGKVLDEQKRILFIFDGFEALGCSLLQPEGELSSDPREVKPLGTTLMSLLKKTVLPGSSLLITTRPTGLQSLGRCLEGECFAEILGFSGATRKEYFHRHFKNPRQANVALRFARGNEILYGLCVIPIVSWTLCTTLEQELGKKKNLLEFSKATTWITLCYLLWLMRCRGQDKPWELQRFLHKLCSLAADGVWKHKVVFEEKEIKERGLNQPDLLPLFLNERISEEGVDGSSYSFTHLHLQAFFAAMFYVLEKDEEAVGDSGALGGVKVLLENYSESREDLNPVVRFLFGLVSQKATERIREAVGCRTSPRAREDVLRWLQGRHGGTSQPGRGLKVSGLDTFHLLLETAEESFVQRVLGPCTDLELQDVKLTLYDQLALSFCLRQWAGLGWVTLRGCSLEQQDPEEELARTEAPGAGEHPHPQLELHSPIHPLCQALQHPGSTLRALRLQWCQLSESCCAELGVLLAQHPSLTHLELGDGTVGDTGVRLLCQGLRQPGCRLRVLRLWYTHLTSACCQDLAAVLGTSPCLEELDLSFSEGLRDEGVRLLCEGLQHPTCHLQTLRLGSCRLTGACCGALATRVLETPHLTCLDLSDNELGSEGVLQLCQQLQHPACPLRALGLSTSGLNEEALQELAALQRLKPELKIGCLLEQDPPQTGAMARLPFHRGVLMGGRKGLPTFRRGPHL